MPSSVGHVGEIRGKLEVCDQGHRFLCADEHDTSEVKSAGYIPVVLAMPSTEAAMEVEDVMFQVVVAKAQGGASRRSSGPVGAVFILMMEWLQLIFSPVDAEDGLAHPLNLLSRLGRPFSLGLGGVHDRFEGRLHILETMNALSKCLATCLARGLVQHLLHHVAKHIRKSIQTELGALALPWRGLSFHAVFV